jgi:uncharacterized damage-inducible protein DinB
MSVPAQHLAQEFEQVNNTLIAVVESFSDEQWRTFVPDEGRTIGVLAHHVAAIHALVADWIQQMASGQAGPPITMDMVHEANAHHMEEHAHCTKEETIALLRCNGAMAAEVVRAVADEHLDRSAHWAIFGDQPVTARFLIEHILIDHPQGHLNAMQGSLGIERP